MLMFLLVVVVVVVNLYLFFFFSGKSEQSKSTLLYVCITRFHAPGSRCGSLCTSSYFHRFILFFFRVGCSHNLLDEYTEDEKSATRDANPLLNELAFRCI